MFQDDTTGLRFGNFEVLVRPDGSIHELGRGGFGRTLLARHSLLNTRVALKIIDERHAFDEAARGRFLKEAREQARLTHPGIARITDCGLVEGQLYYAVELCPDGHLRDLVANAGPLNVADTFHILLQAAEALEFSHRNGVVHLDVKPSNLMLVFDGDGLPQVKLIDFGLVQQQESGAAPAFHSSQPLFSAPFASPEQIRSRPTDGRSDIFSLGMTGWFLLTGSNPVEGTADVVIRERLSPGEYESALPPQLTGNPRAVLARMIRKNPADRYDNSADLIADLRACLKTMPPLAGGWQHRRRSSGALADRFTLEKGIPAREGMVHQAIDRETRQRVKVTLLRSTTMSQAVAQFHRVREIMSGMEGSGLLRVLEVRQFNEGWVVVEESSSGVSLTEILRSEGAMQLSRYAPLVWQLGAAMDTAFTAGLTNVLLDEATVDQPSGAGRRGIDWVAATVRMPLAAGAPGPAASQDGDVTLTGDFTRTGVSGAGVQLLARWVYFIVGGKNPPNSALFSIKEYIAIPGLGDQGNQILARHLCGQSAPALCRDMLRPLFAAEGLSWEWVGDKVRQARWGKVIQESVAVTEEIEAAVTAAENLVASCEPLAAVVPEEVKRCYDAAASVYEAANAARIHQTQLSQGDDRSASAGQKVIGALREISSQARASLQRAEAAFQDVTAAVEKEKRLAEKRERRHRELVESLAEAWMRTEAATDEIASNVDECRRLAHPADGLTQMEELASRAAGLVAQMQTLHDEAGAAPESQWEYFEQQVPGAGQIAADALEMARTCKSLLEKARADARRREEESRRREAALAALMEAVRQAQQSAEEANALVSNISAATHGFPELQETEQRAEADGRRIGAIVQELQSWLAGDQTDVAMLERAQQQAATVASEPGSLVNGLKTALKHALKTAGELRLRAGKFAAAAATLTEISATGAATAATAVEKSRHHGLTAGDVSPAAGCLAKAVAAADEAAKCQEKIAILSVELDPRGSADPDKIVDEARRLAAECDRQAAETVRHLREAEYYIAEAERQAQLEAEAARARAAAALAAVVTQVDREIKRVREAFTRAGRHAEIASAVAAVSRASEAWSATQSKHRLIRQWQTARPPEAATDGEFLQLLSDAARDLASFAESAERAAAEADTAAKEAAREAEERRRQELEASRRRADEERRQREEEARRKAAEEEARQQALLAEQREQEERARQLAAAEEKRRQAELAEQRRREEEARLKAEAVAAERRRTEEEAQRKAAEEARKLADAEEKRRQAELAEQRRREEESRLKAEAAAAEHREREAEARRIADAAAAEQARQRRREEEARLKAEAEAAELRRREEEARRIADADELRRREEAATRLRLAEEAKRKAEAEAQQKREAEEKRRQAEAAEQRRLEAEAKRGVEAAEKRRMAEEAARLKQEADAKRKAEAEENRRMAEETARLKREADAKRKAEADAKRKAEADAKRKAAADEKRRQAEEAAILKREAETKRQAEAEARRNAEAEEKRRQAGVAAELKRVSEARQKASQEEERERQQAELRRQAEQAKRHPEAAAAASVISRPDKGHAPRRGKGPLVAAAALVIIGGGAAAWWAVNRNGDAPPRPSPVGPDVVQVKPPPDPPGTAHYTTSISFSGVPVAMTDLALSGHDPAATAINDQGIQFKTAAGSANRTVSLSCTRKGLRFDPATLVIRADGNSQQDVLVSRETGSVSFVPDSAGSRSFYSRAVFEWAADPGFASPGKLEHTVELPETAKLSTGRWLVTLDDDEPGEGKPGKAGVIVDRLRQGTCEIAADQTAGPVTIPDGLPPLLYSVMNWQTQTAAGDESVKEQNLLDMLANVRLPADTEEVRRVVSGLARTAAMPLFSYPLYLARRDDAFFIVRPQRKDFLVQMNLGIDRLAMAAAIARVLQVPVASASLNPATGAAPGARIPWRSVSDRLSAARDALAGSDHKVVQELHAEITSSLNILSLILHDNWTVPAADAATWASAWKETTEPCSDVRVQSNGEVTLRFKMSDISTRTLVIKPVGRGQYPVIMPEGSAPDEKDTFSGSFNPVPQLPAPLAGKLSLPP